MKKSTTERRDPDDVVLQVLYPRASFCYRILEEMSELYM